MPYNNKIKKLKAKIEETLLPLIDSSYIYLDLPYHKNIGDTLIWEGTRQFLQSVKHKNLYQSSVNRCHFVNIPKNSAVVLHGGGNFGDLYRIHQDFRIEVIRRYRDNRIIILPQSVFYNDRSQAAKDALQMSEHKNLWICARDNASFEFLKKFFKNNIILLPDIAFAIEPASLQKYRAKEEEKALLLKRTDKELDMSVKYGAILQNSAVALETRDWPTYEKEFRFDKTLRRLTSKTHIPEFVANFYADKYFRPAMIKQGVAFISSYKHIYTTRLHGAILSFLLGKSCEVFDNTYNKNSNFINTWLKDMPEIKII